MHDYIPERDDYLNWEEDWNKIPEWDDGTHSIINDFQMKLWLKLDHRTIHREGDKPAGIDENVIIWKKNGLVHRDNDKPAIIFADGRREWYNDGKKERLNSDKPVKIYEDGYKEWHIEHMAEYLPVESIRRSIFFNPKFELVQTYLDDFSLYPDAKAHLKELFTEDLQKFLIKSNPKFIQLISTELLIPEYEGLGILNDVGL